ncbi:hypothetical protein [uncultured Thiodictyon sp.]|nr:hypothetical protein [uncultured Thiodictyon sp.]
MLGAITSSLIAPLFAAFSIDDPAARYQQLLGQAMDALRAPIEVSP